MLDGVGFKHVRERRWSDFLKVVRALYTCTAEVHFSSTGFG